MRKNLILLLGCIAILQTGCASEQSSTSAGGGGSVPPTTTPAPAQTKIPAVGEVRKWFDAGVAGETQIYNYCPSAFIENDQMFAYFCTNRDEGNVTDYVGYRQGTYTDHWSFSDVSYVLEPTPDTWDRRHTCDPAVIKGKFAYNEEEYGYLMAYLGCITSDNSHNETGLAVAKSPAGPWIKCNAINPIVPFDPDFAAWGTGQPDLVSVDGEGRVVLFVTVGNTNRSFTQAYEYNFSNLNEPELIRTKILATNGILSFGNSYSIVNATYSYDVANKKIIMAKGRLPYGLDSGVPEFIADTIDVYYMDDADNDNMFDELFKGNAGKNWQLMGSINKDLTGFDRNHNNGIVTDPYGRTIAADRIEVAFTRSDLASSLWNYLSTYRIYSTAIGFTYEH